MRIVDRKKPNTVGMYAELIIEEFALLSFKNKHLQQFSRPSNVIHIVFFEHNKVGTFIEMLTTMCRQCLDSAQAQESCIAHVCLLLSSF